VTLRSLPARGFAAALAITTVAGSALAQESSFVPEDKCGTRDCTCDDAPMMERFRDNQIKAQKAWQSVKNDLVAGTGPRSLADAETLFRNRLGGGDSVLTQQFKSCPGYDAAKNDLGKIAGVSPAGEAVLDPCFCASFCKDVVHSTVVHEKSHRDTAIPFVAVMTGMQIGCKALKGLKESFAYQCDTVSPVIRANSELVAYQAGIDSLQAAITKLEMDDPMNPGVECTWKPIVESSPTTPMAASPAPAGFLDRVRLLWNRLIHGAGS
jgi:hypothetical protein